MDARQSRLEKRFDTLEQKVSDLDEVQAKAVLHQELEIIPKLQLVYENQLLLIDTKADKADIDALREDLDIQKSRIDAIAEFSRR